MATAVWGVTMRATSDRVLVCAKSGVSWGQSPLPVAPDAERETLYVQVFPTSARLFDTLITDYGSPISDYRLLRIPPPRLAGLIEAQTMLVVRNIVRIAG